MIDRDSQISAALEQMVPPTRESRDWHALLVDAESQTFAGAFAPKTLTRRHNRRLLVLTIVLAIAVLIPLTALAVGLASGQGWWFLSAYTPKPAGAVLTVESGNWDTTPWSLTAFRARTGAICYAVTANPSNPSRALSVNSAEACGAISSSTPITFLRDTGLPQLAASRNAIPLQKANARRRRRGLPPLPVAPAPLPFPDYIVGTVTGSATEIDVAGPHTTLQRIPTIVAPGGLNADVRFFIAKRPENNDVSSITARNAQGAAIATTTVDSPYHLKNYGLINPGKELPLTHEAIHQLRLHHRSPDIYLLGSHDGLNLYRLGTTGKCFGSGRASNMRWVPPDRVMRIVGIISCGGQFPSPTSPIRDTSIYGQNAGQKLMTLYQFSGIASNEVAAVDLIDANGTIVKQVPITSSGIFSINPVPPGVVDVVALNPGGVWVSCSGFGKGAYPTTRAC